MLKIYIFIHYLKNKYIQLKIKQIYVMINICVFAVIAVAVANSIIAAKASRN